jgi:hypothetical protein
MADSVPPADRGADASVSSDGPSATAYPGTPRRVKVAEIIAPIFVLLVGIMHLTVVATAVLLLHLPTVSALASVARAAGGSHPEALGGDLFHAGGGLLVLLSILGLNVHKPRGLTPYGRRKQQEQAHTAR